MTFEPPEFAHDRGDSHSGEHGTHRSRETERAVVQQRQERRNENRKTDAVPEDRHVLGTLVVIAGRTRAVKARLIAAVMQPLTVVLHGEHVGVDARMAGDFVRALRVGERVAHVLRLAAFPTHQPQRDRQ